jgi:outer membrane protein assembly factor BamB
MLRMLTIGAALAGVVAVLAGGSSAQTAFPQVIKLPTGFQPEGIEVGRGTTFYVGSVANGAIYRGNLRTGRGAILIPGASGKAATGIEFDSHNRLFVAGGSTGRAHVYNARTGALIRTYTFATSDTFINDVAIVTTGAFFTDSRKAVLHHVPIDQGGALDDDAHTIPIAGDFSLAPGFNLNGIDAARNDDLVAVQSNTGRLFRIDPATGQSRRISLGAESVPNGDGILLNGRTLYVVQNRDNRVAVIALAANLASGRVIRRLSDPDFDVPTTIDDLGRRLYAVNARFGTPNPGSAAYQVVQLRKPRGR